MKNTHKITLILFIISPYFIYKIISYPNQSNIFNKNSDLSFSEAELKEMEFYSLKSNFKEIHQGLTECIIIAHASEVIDIDYLRSLKQKKIIIALDGASNLLKKNNFIPNYILGDLDSISEETKKFYGIQEKYLSIKNIVKIKYGINLVPALNQNYTDLEKGSN